jgi:hypothetical protein
MPGADPEEVKIEICILSKILIFKLDQTFSSWSRSDTPQ